MPELNLWAICYTNDHSHLLKTVSSLDFWDTILSCYLTAGRQHSPATSLLAPTQSLLLVPPNFLISKHCGEQEAGSRTLPFSIHTHSEGPCFSTLAYLRLTWRAFKISSAWNWPSLPQNYDLIGLGWGPVIHTFFKLSWWFQYVAKVKNN